MSKVKYPDGTIIRHNKSGIIAKIIGRDFNVVLMEVLKGDPTKAGISYFNYHSTHAGEFRLEYSPNSVNRLFTDLGPASKILYAKD